MRQPDRNQGVELEIGTIYNRESFGQMLLILAELTPALFGAGALIYTGPGSINTMSFYSKFDNGSFRPQPYKDLKDKSGLIDTFANSLDTPRKRISGFQHGNDYWLAWYDAYLEKFIIYKF